MQLPPGILLRRDVLSNTRIFTEIFQFLRERDIEFDKSSREPLIIQVAEKLYPEDVMDECVDYL